MSWVGARYAERSIRRNVRRSALSIVGIAIGCVLALTMESLNRGKMGIFASIGASGGAGHVRVVPGGWNERRDLRLRLADADAVRDAIRDIPGVAFVVPRVRAQVLLAMGTHSVPVELAGVDPSIEPKVFRYVRTVEQGRYLRGDDSGAIVLGRSVAERLTAGVDDDIVATAMGPRGEIVSMMLRIVGVVNTGTEEGDQAVCQAVLADVEQLSGVAGLGELSIVVSDYRRADAIAAALRARLATSDEVMTLVQILPELDGHLKQDAASSRLISVLILVIVLLGVTSAQLAAVLERRREFAVLAALGMSGSRMVRLLFDEAVILGLCGAALGLAAGAPLVWRLARRGLDLSAYLGGNYSFQGVLIEPVLHGDFGPWMVWYVFAVAIAATVVASIYPAWFATRLDPAAALRVAQ